MPRKVRKKYHYLYRTTNLITKEFYIGVHSTYNLEDGYLGSGTKLWRKIQKYGRENFEKEILKFFETKEEKFNKEKEIVNEQFLQDPLCMNLKIGGEGGFSSDNHSTKSRKKAVEKLKWLHKNDIEWVKNLKKKQSIGQTKRYEKNKNLNFYCDWTGRKHSSESIEKMKKSKNVGEKNSQFGTCWITNDKENKKIKKQELENWMELGWKRGRI